MTAKWRFVYSFMSCEPHGHHFAAALLWKYSVVFTIIVLH
jgi:hypothetical protein